MLKLNMTQLSIVAAIMCLGQASMAQETAALRDPLIPCAPSSPPFVPAPEGQPPAIGTGPTPRPVTPGMGGSPELKPWVTNIGATSIDQMSTGIPLPVSPGVVSPPGIMGPALSPFIPPPPSTPGPNPGPLSAPPGFINPSEMVGVMPGGGLPGTGGYYTTIPTQRRGGQQSHEWGFRERHSVMGGGGDSQDEVTRLGPWAGWGVPYGVPTGDGMRNNSIDLGGGMRYKVGGIKIPTGTSLQDYGLSSTRDCPVMGENAQQSFEFGQGFRREPIYSSNTTDFGFPYMQFNPANENPQKQDQLLNPTAIETNF
jgi:hypothetical protein